jgi:hypothetical protein
VRKLYHSLYQCITYTLISFKEYFYSSIYLGGMSRGYIRTTVPLEQLSS